MEAHIKVRRKMPLQVTRSAPLVLRQLSGEFSLRTIKAFLTILIVGSYLTAQTVPGAASSTTVLKVSSATATLGSPVTLTATVTVAGEPATIGQVSFLDGARVLGTAQVGSTGPSTGMARLVTTSFGVGQHTLTATYWGAPAVSPYAQSSSSAQELLTVTGGQASSTVSLTSSPRLTVSGGVDLTATIFGARATATGIVDFRDTSTNTLLGTAALLNGLGSFSPQPSLPLVDSSAAIASADVNGDGFPDLVIHYGSTTTFLLNSPSNPGHFLPSQVSYTTLAMGGSVVAADLNGDGAIDCVIYGDTSQGLMVSILFGDPKNPGLFQGEVDYQVNLIATLSLADVNGDGLLDIVIQSASDSSLAPLVLYADNLNPGHFLSTNPVSVSVDSVGVNTPLGPIITASSSTLSADLNGDGVADSVTPVPGKVICEVFWPYVCETQRPDSVSVAIADTSHPGNFLQQGTYPVGIDPTQIVAGDFNGDGCTDLAIIGGAANGGDPSVTLLFGVRTLTSSLPGVIATTGDQLIATYSGDGSNLGSSSQPFSAPGIGTNLLLYTPSNVLGVGTSVLLSAVASAPGTTPPPGSVTFYDGPIVVGSSSLDGNGDASYSAVLSTGSHLISATYPTTGAFASSTSSSVNTVIFGSSNLAILSASPPTPASQPSFQVGRTTLTWSAPAGVTGTELRIDAPDGQLFTSGGPTGSAATGLWVTEGMAFYLQDVSGGKPLTATNTLAIVCIHLSVEGYLTAVPNPIFQSQVVDGIPRGVTSLYWSAPAGVSNTELHIDSPDGPLFTEGGSTGTATTGLWASDGMTFFLQDTTGGKPLTAPNILGSVTVHVQKQQPVLFSASPDPIADTALVNGVPVGTTTLTWNAPNATTVRIYGPVGEVPIPFGELSGTTAVNNVTDGTTFFLVDESNISKPITLASVIIHLARPVQFSASPNPITDVTLVGEVEAGVTTLSWSAPTGVTSTEIHVNAPNGPAFSGGGPSGTATTSAWAQEGMIFYLQDTTAGKPLSAANTLATTTIHLQPQVQFSADPNPITKTTVVDGLPRGVTTLSWNVPGVGSVEVLIGSPNGVPFSGGGPVGTATTGLWVTDGMTFYLQDTTGGKPLTPANTLGVVRVTIGLQ
jgi:Bacterial Ig-like domain (group 3)/FG-GAP-like repeat